MSFRRSSSLSREDGLTLEQRLVMQLTAAMHHEDAMVAVDENHPADGSRTQSQEAVHTHHELPQPPPHQPSQQLTNELLQNALHQTSAAQPGHAPDGPSIDINELLRSFGVSLESIGSAIGSHVAGRDAQGNDAQVSDPQPGDAQPGDAHGHGGHIHGGHIHGGHIHGAHEAHDHEAHSGSAPSATGSLEALGSLGNLSNLGSLGSLLSSLGSHENTHESAHSGLGSTIESLGHLGSLADMGSLGDSGHAASEHTAISSTDAHKPHESLPGSTETQQAPERTPTHAELASASHETTAASNLDPSSLGFSPVEIDPDVSSIQSVLQSLLMGGSGTGTTAEHPADAAAQTAGPTSSNETHVASDSVGTSENVLPLSSFGLETEDQMLVDSLRSAIESQLTGAADSHALESAESASETDGPHAATQHATGSRTTTTTTKPRTQSRTRKPRQSMTQSDEFSSSTFRDQTSDFGASDPDTLRAIQQALLSALGPSASSMSLTESITSELKATPSSAGPSDPLANSTASAVSDAQAAAVAGPSAAPSLDSSLRPTSKAPERALKVPPAKKVTTKITKPSERDRQKLREENAARKRRWREENVLQNRDNDLRARIIRRAQTMYGEGESAEKSEWIEAEYQRRRQKRILRADINSLVANAMESARSRASSGQIRTRYSGQPLTLSQQTRQIASTQLSELFKRSNAVLEPQLHAEKVSVPLAPYLLVPSPNRPPYKVGWNRLQTPGEGQQEPSPSAADSPHNAAAKPLSTGETSKAASQVSVQGSAQDSAQNNRHTSDGNNKPEQGPGASALESAAGAATETAPSAPSPSGAPAASAVQSTAKPPQTEESPTQPQPTKVVVDNKPSLLAMRPKHRYGLVGNAQLGVPPNLAAIYHKVMSAPESA